MSNLLGLSRDQKPLSKFYLGSVILSIPTKFKENIVCVLYIHTYVHTFILCKEIS